MIEVNMTDAAGVVLSTSGKYCKENILVHPTLQIKTIDVSKNGSTYITADEGKCGLSDVIVNVDVPIHDTYLNAEGVEF